MTSQDGRDSIVTAAAHAGSGALLPQRQKVVLVIDLVESVRLMSANELGVIEQWRGFLQFATGNVLPHHGGRLVKSLGDGLMAEFDSAREGVAAALELQAYFEAGNASRPADERMYLRAGLNLTHVYVDEIDIYGSGVNLAARVATLAGPGETMVTAAVRDGLTEGLDAHVEDMGECYVKHVAEPIRVFRAGSAGPTPVLLPEREYLRGVQPTIAVIPFSGRSMGAEHLAIGELIADGVIAHMGKTTELKVISRLATTVLRHRDIGVREAGAQLKADYVLSGSYVVIGSRLLLTAELVGTGSEDILWVDRLNGDVADLLRPNSELCYEIALQAHQAVLGSAVQKAMHRPLPTLAGQALMFAGIAGVHHVAPEGFDFSGKALSAVIERHPRHAEAYAWLAKWHAIGTNRGLGGPSSRKIAADLADRAVQALPDSPFTLTISGLVKAYYDQDLEGAARCYGQALAANPNELLAWLYTATLCAWQGRGPQAGEAARRALELAPIGPMQYYVQSLAGLALLCAGDLKKAIEILRHSLRLNGAHTSTHRALTMALTLDGQVEEARQVVQALLRLEPRFSVEIFLQRYGGRAHPHAKVLADALKEAGVPAN
ncbi:adenylate/guanylate cyclase domain-containing protein [Ramlibacter alkalitolerans]|uniref:Guanylate cyclase domain-containing protein n=1 Tax=Ramlibacter alkalitolerans TaxID=2039631 RepID=A0ABS1JX40_9BURK|nr:adenylate/guanylate cyclase domain-containing protein [Ramlibacter alkalitolerans]MBL0428431.1 hypothetical protein [Ramlibacter alkalitolerans]